VCDKNRDASLEPVQARFAQAAQTSLAAAQERVEALPRPAGASLVWVDAGGRRLLEVSGGGAASGRHDPAACRQSLREAFRWGESYFRWLGEERLAFTLPLTFNQELAGGLVVEATVPDEASARQSEVLAAMRSLSSEAAAVLEQTGLLNGALMRENAANSSRERLRAEALHEAKTAPARQLREIYWRLEPELFLAMRRGERREARRLLNLILVSSYNLGREELPRIKGYLLDLVTAMSRTMVDCGADPARMLGGEMDRLRVLDRIDDEEELGRWLSEVLEGLIDAVEEAPAALPHVRIQLILNYMREHCDEAIGRDHVAAKAGLSQAHFSRLLKAATGNTFKEEFLRMRMEKALRLLRRSPLGILAVANDCSFRDQSHFTKVFKRRLGTTPAQFRAQYRGRNREHQSTK